MQLEGKLIWLVGASEGIGEALAHRMAEAGGILILSSRNEVKLDTLQKTLGERHRVLPLDVCDASMIDHAWQYIIKDERPLDMVIYNAGTYEPMSAMAYDLPKIERMIDVNLHGALRVLSHVLPYFINRNNGHIVLVASVAGYRGLPSAMGYGLSKAALIHLAENLTADLAKTNVTVTTINPGFVKTALTAKNVFPMPFIITPEKAADYIMRGLNRNRREIDFPKRFTFWLKFMRRLPAGIYFWLLKFAL